MALGTMVRAVRWAVGQGLVTVVPGGGILAGAGAPESADAASAVQRASVADPLARRPLPPAALRWERVREQVAIDIAAGVWPAGSVLPPCKVLGQRYATCHSTLRRALLALRSDGKIVSHGRGYRVFQPRARSTLSTIVFIGVTTEMEVLSTYTVRSEQFWRTLEVEMARANARLEIRNWRMALGWEPRPDGKSATVLADKRAGNVLGYVVWTHGIAADDLAQLLGLLARTGEPVSVLDEDGSSVVAPVLQNCPGRPLLKVFTIGNSGQCGRDMGNYLIGLGHRSVAFFSQTDADWSTNRYTGLQAAFAELGPAASAVRLQVPRRDASGGDHAYTGALADLNRRFRSLEASLRQWPAAAYLTYNLSNTSRSITARQLSLGIAPLLEQALADTRVSAWVCDNDMLALAAQGFLAGRRMKAGRDLSLVGFDDMVETFVNRLTSYNFNMHGTALAMLEHLLGGSARRRSAAGRGIVELPGRVVERESSGPPRT